MTANPLRSTMLFRWHIRCFPARERIPRRSVDLVLDSRRSTNLATHLPSTVHQFPASRSGVRVSIGRRLQKPSRLLESNLA